MSVVGSIGLIHLWDMDEGCTVLDPFFYSQEDYIVAGSLFGVGKKNLQFSFQNQKISN
jgi:hypothetical protein